VRNLALRSRDRLGVGKSGQRLVALGGQQESLQVAPETLALSASTTKEVVEARGVLLKRAGGRGHGQSSGHGGTSLCAAI